MTKMDKATGRGEIRGQQRTMKQSERGSESLRRQQGSQGRRGRGGRGPLRTLPRAKRRSARLVDQEEKISEQVMKEKEEQATNPFAILRMDEEEESEDEEMKEKIDEMLVASPQRSPRRPAVKRTEREDASVGSMRRPLICGKHESDVEKTILEGERNEIMEKETGMKEGTLREEETQAIEEIAEGDDFRYASQSKQDTKGSNEQRDEEGVATEAIEDDDLSYLGEEPKEEEDTQVEGIKAEKSAIPEEEEWEETELEEETEAIRAKLVKEIRAKLEKKRYEELEGKDSEVESKRSVKLAAQEEN